MLGMKGIRRGRKRICKEVKPTDDIRFDYSLINRVEGLFCQTRPVHLVLFVFWGGLGLCKILICISLAVAALFSAFALCFQGQQIIICVVRRQTMRGTTFGLLLPNAQPVDYAADDVPK